MTFNPNFFRQYFGGRPLHYILENGVPRPVSLMEWAEWFETHERRILQDFVCKARANKTTAVRVSTVFLGLDHNFFPGGPPLIFETMVFGDELNLECDRYSTLEEAEDGHLRMVKRVKEAEKE